MERAEIEQYLYAAPGHSITVDAQEVPAVPGNVRTVTIRRGNRVNIEYDQSRAYAEGGTEGGGLRLHAQYSTLDDLIADLEGYLGAPVEQWSNFTKSPLHPKVLDDPDPEASRRYFEELVRKGTVPVPRNGRYSLVGVHWRHIAKYGEYRDDKLFEEQDEEFLDGED